MPTRSKKGFFDEPEECPNYLKVRNYVPERVSKLDEYVPNTADYKIRLDANECPFNPTPEIIEEFAEAVKKIQFNRYPDPMATELLETISDAYHILTENLVVGNGSDELISLICGGFTDPGDKVVVAVPDFSMYEFYSALNGAEVIRYNKDEKNNFDLDELSKFSNEIGAKIVIFSNPCNPTGYCKPAIEIEKFIIRTEALVVLDEAYNEFSYIKSSIFNKAGAFDNLIVLKTLSKAYGMAAIRLGIAAANVNIISAIRKIKSPYNVNSLTQELAKIIIKHKPEIDERAEKIKKETSCLYNLIDGIRCRSFEAVYPTCANFVLVKMTSPEIARALTDELKERGIAIRCFEKSSSIRVSCGTHEENEILAAEMADSLKKLEGIDVNRKIKRR